MKAAERGFPELFAEEPEPEPWDDGWDDEDDAEDGR
jgi:hypothetical protein